MISGGLTPGTSSLLEKRGPQNWLGSVSPSKLCLHRYHQPCTDCSTTPFTCTGLRQVSGALGRGHSAELVLQPLLTSRIGGGPRERTPRNIVMACPNNIQSLHDIGIPLLHHQNIPGYCRGRPRCKWVPKNNPDPMTWQSNLVAPSSCGSLNGHDQGYFLEVFLH